MCRNAITIGVSSCLLGEKVRYDGGHRHDHYITDVLGKFFAFVPVCPEVECGLPVPREPMRLEGEPGHPRLMTVETRLDKTDQMLAFCRDRVEALEHDDLCGFIFKKGSPSSGLHHVKVYKSPGSKEGKGKSGATVKSGRGLFAREVTRAYPFLPVEEEGRLVEAQCRENFIGRVFTYSRWKRFLESDPDLGDLVQFHTAHKFLVMAHSPTIYRELGALVGKGAQLSKAELFLNYGELLMMAMAMVATVKKHTDVLMHIMGFFKAALSREEKEELLDLIRQYHDHQVPQVVPVTMLKHYCLKFNDHYLRQQLYLSPDPTELALRNHV